MEMVLVRSSGASFGEALISFHKVFTQMAQPYYTHTHGKFKVLVVSKKASNFRFIYMIYSRLEKELVSVIAAGSPQID